MINLPSIWTERVRPAFAVDLRSLALFRFLLGLLLFFDSLGRLGDVGAFYTDSGVMPRALLAAMDAPWRWSLHMSSGAAWFQTLLILLQALSGLALALGWRSRTANAIAWLLTVSICNRNPLVLGDGDLLLCALLFWSLFLPLSARWSIDAALARTPPPIAQRHLSWASAALVIQVLSVFFFNALLRSGSEWWPDFSAGYYALSLDNTVRGAGPALLGQPGLLQGLTAWAWWLQLIGPPLLLLPLIGRAGNLGKVGVSQLIRALVLVQLALLQIVTIFTIDLGNMPWIQLVALSALAGSGYWDWRLHRLSAGRSGTELRVFYDRDCGFCLKICRLLVQLLILPQARLLPAQDNRRADALLRANDSWIVIDHDDTAHLKSAAMIVLLRRSPLLGGVGRMLQRPAIFASGDRAYDWVARHRPMLGRITARLLPERDVAFVASPRKQTVASALMTAVLIWNLAGLEVSKGWVESVLEPPLGVLGLDQHWDLFAPSPSRNDGWWVVPGKLADGSDVDVLHPQAGAPRFDKPTDLGSREGGFRWRSYQRRLSDDRYEAQRLQWSRYLCRQWNASLGPDSRHWLIDFKLIDMLEVTPAPGSRGGLEQHVLWRQDCSAAADAEPPGRETR